MFASQRFLTVFAALCASGVASTQADAQIFRMGPFGGVSIRAPFASVDVGPYGGASVAAPFAAVRAPGVGYPAPYYSRRAVIYGGPGVVYAPPIPSPFATPAVGLYGPSVRVEAEVYRQPVAPVVEQSAAYESPGVSSDRLLQELEFAGQTLARSLSNREGGEAWLDYLRPHQLGDLARQGDLRTLSDLLRNYNGTQSNRELAWVSSAAGFQTTQRMLSEWLRRAASANVEAASRPAPTPAVEPTRRSPPAPATEPTPAIQPLEADGGVGSGGEAEAIPAPLPEPQPQRVEA